MAPNAEKPGTIRARAPHISSGVPKGFENEVMIDGEWYNIDSFAKKHPGGRIINFYRGKDARCFFAFHVKLQHASTYNLIFCPYLLSNWHLVQYCAEKPLGRSRSVLLVI